MPGILMLFGIAFIYLAATRKFSALLGVVNNTPGTQGQNNGGPSGNGGGGFG